MQTILQKIKKKGISGLLKYAYHRIVPNRAHHLSIYLEALQGKKGLEIGGPSKKFMHNGILPVYDVISELDGVNFSSETVWEGSIQEGKNFIFDKSKEKGYQYISDAVDLSKIPSDSYDFLLSCHSIEHIANPFRALNEWLRVLKPDGFLLIVVPHKEGTFDYKRPVTKIEHMIEDFENEVHEDDLTCLEEVLSLTDISLDPGSKDIESLKARSLKNFENRCLHHHVFDTDLVVKIFDHLKLKILATDAELPHDIIVLGQKTTFIPDNKDFLSTDATFRKISPFKLDSITKNKDE